MDEIVISSIVYLKIGGWEYITFIAWTKWELIRTFLLPPAGVLVGWFIGWIIGRAESRRTR